MPYRITYDRTALADMKHLLKKDRVRVQAQIDQFLTHRPAEETAARIRRLKGSVFPPFRLRIDPYRVLYEVDEEDSEVIVHGIGEKPEIYARLVRLEDDAP